MIEAPAPLWPPPPAPRIPRATASCYGHCLSMSTLVIVLAIGTSAIANVVIHIIVTFVIPLASLLLFLIVVALVLRFADGL